MQNQFSFRVNSELSLNKLFEIYINKKNNFDSSIKQDEIKKLIDSFSSTKELFEFYTNINIDKIISNLEEINKDINSLIYYSYDNESYNNLQNFFYYSTKEILLSLLKNDLFIFIDKINSIIPEDNFQNNYLLSDLETSSLDRLSIDIKQINNEIIFSRQSTRGKSEETYITPKFFEKKIIMKISDFNINETNAYSNSQIKITSKKSEVKISKFKLNIDNVTLEKNQYTVLLNIIKQLYKEGKINEEQRKFLKKKIFYHDAQLIKILNMNLSIQETNDYIQNLLV
jgi:hypothetical protein